MAKTKQGEGRRRTEKRSQGQARAASSKKATVQKLTPEAPEAHDEGPRLIPFAGPSFSRAHMQEPTLPTDGYVALADRAMAMWKQREEEPRKRRK